MPIVFGIAGIGLWQAAVWELQVPNYVLPGPIAIVQAYIGDYGTLNAALLSTLTVTFAALLVSAALGVALALAMARRSREFAAGSGRPCFAASVMSRENLENSLERIASCLPFLCMMFLN